MRLKKIYLIIIMSFEIFLDRLNYFRTNILWMYILKYTNSLMERLKKLGCWKVQKCNFHSFLLREIQNPCEKSIFPKRFQKSLIYGTFELETDLNFQWNYFWTFIIWIGKWKVNISKFWLKNETFLKHIFTTFHLHFKIVQKSQILNFL